MELTACDWQLVAVALTWNGDDTADPAVGLLTVMLVVAVGVDGPLVVVFEVRLALPQPASRRREAKRTR
jgi:hypothetical protein